MKPTLDNTVISSLKADLKTIGDLTVDLCGSSNQDIRLREKAREINKLAFDMYELILMEENSNRSELNLNHLNERGISRV